MRVMWMYDVYCLHTWPPSKEKYYLVCFLFLFYNLSHDFGIGYISMCSLLICRSMFCFTIFSQQANEPEFMTSFLEKKLETLKFQSLSIFSIFVRITSSWRIFFSQQHVCDTCMWQHVCLYVFYPKVSFQRKVKQKLTIKWMKTETYIFAYM